MLLAGILKLHAVIHQLNEQRGQGKRTSIPNEYRSYTVWSDFINKALIETGKSAVKLLSDCRLS